MDLIHCEKPLTEVIAVMIEEAKQHLILPDLTLAVIGESGCGKSSVTNALLETTLLPMSEDDNIQSACTQFPIEIRHHDKSTYEIDVDYYSESEWYDLVKSVVELHTDPADGHLERTSDIKLLEKLCGEDFYDGVSKQVTIRTPFEPEINALRNYDCVGIQRTLQQLSSDVTALRVRRCVVRGPIPILRGNLVVQDLPGCGDTNPIRNKYTNAVGDKADVVLVVSRLERCADNKQLHTIVSHSMKHRLEHCDESVLLVINKCDVMSPRRRETASQKVDRIKQRNDNVREKLVEDLITSGERQLSPTKSIFMTSAMYALMYQDYVEANEDLPDMLQSGIEWTEIPCLRNRVASAVSLALERHTSRLNAKVEDVRHLLVRRDTLQQWSPSESVTCVGIISENILKHLSDICRAPDELDNIRQFVRESIDLDELCRVDFTTLPAIKEFGNLHWNTQRAVFHYGGQFRHHHLNYDFTAKLFDVQLNRKFKMLTKKLQKFHTKRFDLLNKRITSSREKSVKEIIKMLGPEKAVKGVEVCGTLTAPLERCVAEKKAFAGDLIRDIELRSFPRISDIVKDRLRPFFEKLYTHFHGRGSHQLRKAYFNEHLNQELSVVNNHLPLVIDQIIDDVKPVFDIYNDMMNVVQQNHTLVHDRIDCEEACF